MGGAKLCIVKKKGLCPQAPSLHPLKQLAAILKSRAGKIRQRRWGRRRKPSVSSLGCDLQEGELSLFLTTPLLGRNSRTLVSRGDPGSSNLLPQRFRRGTHKGKKVLASSAALILALGKGLEKNLPRVRQGWVALYTEIPYSAPLPSSSQLGGTAISILLSFQYASLLTPSCPPQPGAVPFWDPHFLGFEKWTAPGAPSKSHLRDGVRFIALLSLDPLFPTLSSLLILNGPAVL